MTSSLTPPSPPAFGTEGEAGARRFRELFNKAAIPLCFVNKASGGLRFNACFEATFGYGSDEVPTLADWWRLACPDPDYRRAALARCEAAIAAADSERGELETEEYRITCKDGSVRTMVVWGSAIYDDFLLTFYDLTEQKRVEQELRLASFALDRVHDSAFLVDRSGTFRMVNDAACRRLGYAREELLGRKVADVDPDYSVERWADHWRELNEHGALVFESVHRGRDGQVVPVEISANLFTFAGEQYNLGLARDISERKRAETEAAASLHTLRSLDRINRTIHDTRDLEAVLNAVLDDMLDIFVADRAFLLYPHDPTAASWTVPFERTREGFPGARALGEPVPMSREDSDWFSLLDATWSPVLFGPGGEHPVPAAAAARFGIQVILAMVLRPKVGERWYLGLHRCTRHDAWSPADMRLFEEVGRRVTDGLTGLLAHRELREQERQFRTLAENSTDVIIRYDLEGRRLYVNPAFERVNRLTASEALGRTPGEVSTMLKPLAATFTETLKEVIASGRPRTIDLSRSLDDGSLSWWLVRIVPEADADGRIRTALTIWTDISERKAAEEVQRRLNRELRAITACNQAMIRASDERALLHDVCRIICEEAGYLMAWVSYCEPGPGTLRPVAWAGDEAGYIEEALAILARHGGDAAPPVVAARTGEMDGVVDFATDARVAPWREAALRRGYRSTITLPLKAGTGVLALLTIYAGQPDAFTPEERRLLGELAGDLAFGIVALRAHAERSAAEKRIEHLAFYDLLTGLPNRRLFLDRLQHAMTGCARSGRRGALLYIDLDNFKLVNDTCGHDVGDQLLVEVAQRLSACLRDGDTTARLGGDEFVAMLEDLDATAGEAAASARVVADKIHEALNRPYRIGERSHHCTPSVGATLFSGHGDASDELLKQADIAMYQAKSAGKNTLRFFDPEMQASVAARAALEADLRHAIADGQFILHFQPQVSRAGRILGGEALLRWQHPERGTIPPNDFIPLAEETGLILGIGQWVLAEACAVLADWHRQEPTRGIRLAINVSARQFRQPDFVDSVRVALEAAGAPRGMLKLELTESVVLDNVEDTIDKMTALRRLGVGFAMDDFGTGFSSLAYLTRLPLEQLKIDQSFVRRLLDNPTDAVVARSIITLATSLGLTVIAEGVETEAQRAFLAQHGCPIYQGYLFGRPMPLAEFRDLVVRLAD